LDRKPELPRIKKKKKRANTYIFFIIKKEIESSDPFKIEEDREKFTGK